MSSTIPELLLTENKIELLEPYTLAKKHHKMRCTVCNHKWSATPLSKRQTYKKWGVGGCPECKKSRCEDLYKIKRAQNLELLQKKGLKILSQYDGRRTNKKIKFQNENCGHIFEASANNMIYSQTSCIVCGAASRINAATAWSKANSEKWRETAEDWLLYKSRVTSITEKNYRKYHKQINPGGHIRALAGVKGAYHLDHIVSVRMCYENKVPVELCASVDNLQMLPWTDNVTNRQYIKGTISSKFHQYFDCYVRIQPYVAELRKLMPYSRVNHDIGQGIVATIYSASQNLAIFIHPLDVKLANQKILAHAREHCVNNKIDYIMLFEDELNHNFSLVVSKIKHKLAKSDGIRIHARKCTIAEVDKQSKKLLLDEHHSQGNDSCSIAYGAFYEGSLVAVMTFSKPRVALGYKNPDRSKYDGIWELSRFATDTNYRIPGIASKVLSHFKKNNCWSKIISYADCRWSGGNMYHQIGFELEATNPPDYFYIIDGKRKHRWNYRKDMLKHTLTNYKAELTEYQNMVNHGFYRVWDCGTMRFVLKAGDNI